MSSFPSVVPLLVSVVLYTSINKLAAFLYKRARLSWRDACIFSLILLMVLGLGTLLNRLSGNAVPLALLVVAGLVIQVGLGAWFLASRAFGIDGAPLGSRGGAILALIAYALVVSLGVLAGTALTALHP
ncbi:hypothetical protein NHH88_07980 [Oxalobacteraceae bacterium OTU3CAMAD1]|nr:hypothetical protein NHH88_07980 [Oxalobacteraceae bacterium OTU3CAMAD1]